MATRTTEELLSVKAIKKSFGQNFVLRGVDLSLGAGEILALIGGNGAGKSTLMKIIMGIYKADDGTITIDGRELQMTNPSVALVNGIYMVPQEPLLFPNMNVLENITIGFTEPMPELKARLQATMDEIGWCLDLTRKAGTLSIAEQTLVEILRGILRNAHILILDEPTSALTFDEVNAFFRVVKDLQRKSIGIIYITHRLAEVFEIATHVSIMCDGKITATGPVEEFTRESLVTALLPPNVDSDDNQEAEAVCGSEMCYDGKKPIFTLSNFSGYGFNDISLEVYPGEILGIAGVVGAGRTELVSTVFGRDKALSGAALLDGRDVTNLPTREIISAGINFVPEDRHCNGLFKSSTVAVNITSALLKEKRLGSGFLNVGVENAIAREFVERFGIKTTGIGQIAGNLSGGNQQKVVLSRALSTNPKLVILDEPTRGIDAVARGDVYRIIHHLRDQGVSVLMVSSDFEEIIELCDRAVTMYRGRINGEFRKDELTQDNLTAACFGFCKNEQKMTLEKNE